MADGEEESDVGVGYCGVLIEELFSKLKAFIKRHWQAYADNPEQGFDIFLEWCLDTVGRRKQSAEGHFRNCGLTIEKM
jgi:hypothetical protein